MALTCKSLTFEMRDCRRLFFFCKKQQQLSINSHYLQKLGNKNMYVNCCPGFLQITISCIICKWTFDPTTLILPKKCKLYKTLQGGE